MLKIKFAVLYCTIHTVGGFVFAFRRVNLSDFLSTWRVVPLVVAFLSRRLLISFIIQAGEKHAMKHVSHIRAYVRLCWVLSRVYIYIT